MIISKGQGNYESLHDTHQKTFFLLQAKSDIVSEMLNVPLGTNVLHSTTKSLLRNKDEGVMN